MFKDFPNNFSEQIYEKVLDIKTAVLYNTNMNRSSERLFVLYLRKRGFTMIRELTVKNRYVFVIIIFAAIIIAAFGITRANASKPEGHKYYVSITIEPGDTLWSIAEENMSDDYRNVNEYIREVMYTNCLSSADITAGRHIVIPRFTED